MFKHLTFNNLKRFLRAIYYEPISEVVRATYYKLFSPHYNTIHTIKNGEKAIGSVHIKDAFIFESKIIYLKIELQYNLKDSSLILKIDQNGYSLHEEKIFSTKSIVLILPTTSNSKMISLSCKTIRGFDIVLKTLVRRKKYLDNISWNDQIKLFKYLRPQLYNEHFDNEDNIKSLAPPLLPIKDPSFGKEVKITIIIPTKDKVDLLKACLESIIALTRHKDYNIIIIDNNSVEQITLEYFQQIRSNTRIKIVQYNSVYNYAAMHNWVMQYVTTEFVCLLNNDIEIRTEGWLYKILSNFQNPQVGITGCQLLYPDGRIQHDGVCYGRYKGKYFVDHIGKGLLPSDKGQFVPNQRKEVSGVTAACLIIRKKLYMKVNGMDQDLFPIAFNDVDLCLKISELGFKIIQDSRVVHVHHESISRKQYSGNNKSEIISHKKLMIKWDHKLKKEDNFIPNFYKLSGGPTISFMSD